ncbi:MAG TPA: hypothetical protein VK638_35285 [Edaphobacter sp.]|nr:hypothetical protein [Edaphobacter sp.]
MEQTHSHGTTFYERDRNSSRIVEVVEPSISATQIKGMSDLHAYFVQRGFKNNRMVIVPVEIPFIKLREKHPAFVRRMIPQRDFHLPPDVAEVVRRKPPVLPDDASRLVSFSSTNADD